MSHGTFRPTQPITKSQFQTTLATGDSKAIGNAIIDVVNHVYDYHWLLDQIRRLFESGDEIVIDYALLALADMARQEQEATRDDVMGVLRIVEKDTRFQDRIQDVREDIDIFLPA